MCSSSIELTQFGASCLIPGGPSFQVANAGSRTQVGTVPTKEKFGFWKPRRRRGAACAGAPRAGLPDARGKTGVARSIIATIFGKLNSQQDNNVPIVGLSDAAAKKEDREADGAPPKAEEQA